jgi:hypothetical protein
VATRKRAARKQAVAAPKEKVLAPLETMRPSRTAFLLGIDLECGESLVAVLDAGQPMEIHIISENVAEDYLRDGCYSLDFELVIRSRTELRDIIEKLQRLEVSLPADFPEKYGI